MERDAFESAFTEFVDAHYVALVRYGRSLVLDLGRAEDLVQSSLLKTLKAWSRLGPSGAEPYTKTVMVRAAWRSSGRLWRGEIATASPPDAVDRQWHDPLLEAVENRDAVRRALLTLRQQDRIVLALRYLEDLSEAETAERLSIPRGTVKSRTARGLRRLRDLNLITDSPVASEERSQLS